MSSPELIFNNAILGIIRAGIQINRLVDYFGVAEGNCLQVHRRSSQSKRGWWKGHTLFSQGINSLRRTGQQTIGIAVHFFTGQAQGLVGFTNFCRGTLG